SPGAAAISWASSCSLRHRARCLPSGELAGRPGMLSRTSLALGIARLLVDQLYRPLRLYPGMRPHRVPIHDERLRGLDHLRRPEEPDPSAGPGLLALGHDDDPGTAVRYALRLHADCRPG